MKSEIMTLKEIDGLIATHRAYRMLGILLCGITFALGIYFGYCHRKHHDLQKEAENYESSRH